MANATGLDVAEDASSTPPQCPPTSFIYLALYYSPDDVNPRDKWSSDRLSWRLIPSRSSTIPSDRHEVFGIIHDDNSVIDSGNEDVDDPMEDICAFIRFPIQSTKSYENLFAQVQKSSETLLNEAIDDCWQEWEWVYNMFEHLEILDYLDDRVTNTWQYKDKSKMEIFKERVLNLAEKVHDADGPSEERVIDFPLNS